MKQTITNDEWVAAARADLDRRGYDAANPPDPEFIPELDIYVRAIDPLGWVCFSRFCATHGTDHPDLAALAFVLTACDARGVLLFDLSHVRRIADEMPDAVVTRLAARGLQLAGLGQHPAGQDSTL